MIKKRLSLFVALAICALLSIPQSRVYSKKLAQAKGGYVTNQILVKLKSSARSSVDDSQLGKGRVQLAKELLPEHGLRSESLDDADSQAQNSAFMVEFDDNLPVEEAIARAKSDPRVAYAEPNRFLEPASTVPNDSMFNQQWSLLNNVAQGADIGATQAWDLTTGSNDVVVAVTDTGVDIQHPDLAANIWVNSNEIADNGVDDDNNGLVDDINGWNFADNNKNVYDNASGDRHGTFVAGIIGAVGNNDIGVTGVAWRVKLMPLKFISNNSGNIAGAIKAINYAIAQRKKGVNVRVINASWGPSSSECADSFSQSLKDAITAAGDAGILFVSSAGNGVCGTNRSLGDNLDVAPEYPAAWSGELTNALSVGAVGRNDSLLFFSNYGHSSVGVAAPGDELVTSTLPAGNYGTFFPGGTSFAAPHVTGIAALLAAHEPTLTAAQIKQRIISTAEPILPLASKVVGSGRANAYNALANRAAPLPTLGINSIQVSKKFADIDGLGFVQGAIVVEINGVPFGNTKYDGSYALANGSLTRVFVKAPKPDIKAAFPVGIPVNVTVFNKNTGERSPIYVHTQR